jgi:uncharacterized protein YyaL (SSP411 family)
MSDKPAFRNRLADATSPYLQQHADNPVNWYPWGAQALALARAEHKPILLSIGYSACHWCHVMAHESFEDPACAAVMNELYVNIKVDREERPDLDRIYQAAHQLLTGRPGGWPLTMFLNPQDQVPFFGGTYFPDQPRHGLPAFSDLLRQVARAYREHPSEIRQHKESFMQALASLSPQPSGTDVVLDSGPAELARQQLARSYDGQYGGFGKAPKFPHPSSLELLMRHWQATTAAGSPDRAALDMVVSTLEAMALGGVNDQLGGGFCRYSVDDYWMIPHFEKMLYDNAQLLALYLDAWQATANPLFRATAEATADWVQREMQAPEGGYYSSLDADSEGREGAFYVWQPDWVRESLSDQEYPVFARAYGLDRPPNFEGYWHLHRYTRSGELAAHFGISEDEVERRLESARRKLLDRRARRVRPGRDEKVLSAWNALMIRGMARAGRLLERDDYLRSAQRALDFLRTTLWRDGRLLATSRDGRAQLPAYLDDHAFLIEAILELLQARWSGTDLDFALALADLLLERFLDRQEGGFFFTADDHEALIQRPKPLGDESTPSGNGIAARALLRLGHLLGEVRYLEAAEATLKLVWDSMSQLPYAHCTLLTALDEYLRPTETVIVRGTPERIGAWQARLNARYAPRRLALAIADGETGLPGALAERVARPGGIAYVCSGTSCRAPATDLLELDRALVGGEAASDSSAIEPGA